jgi:hypothetical protein
MPPKVALSYPVGIEVALDDQVAQLTIANNKPPSGVEKQLLIRWSIEVRFKGDEPRDLRARLAAANPPVLLDIMLPIVDRGRKYPVHAQVPTGAIGDDFTQARRLIMRLLISSKGVFNTST